MRHVRDHILGSLTCSDVNGPGAAALRPPSVASAWTRLRTAASWRSRSWLRLVAPIASRLEREVDKAERGVSGGGVPAAPAAPAAPMGVPAAPTLVVVVVEEDDERLGTERKRRGEEEEDKAEGARGWFTNDWLNEGEEGGDAVVCTASPICEGMVTGGGRKELLVVRGEEVGLATVVVVVAAAAAAADDGEDGDEDWDTVTGEPWDEDGDARDSRSTAFSVSISDTSRSDAANAVARATLE